MNYKRYEDLLAEIRALFPHCTDVRIEVDTNMDDIKDFSKYIHEHSNGMFVMTTIDKPDKVVYSNLRTPFGMISLNNKDGK